MVEKLVTTAASAAPVSSTAPSASPTPLVSVGGSFGFEAWGWVPAWDEGEGAEGEGVVDAVAGRAPGDLRGLDVAELAVDGEAPEGVEPCSLAFGVLRGSCPSEGPLGHVVGEGGLETDPEEEGVSEFLHDFVDVLLSGAGGVSEGVAVLGGAASDRSAGVEGVTYGSEDEVLVDLRGVCVLQERCVEVHDEADAGEVDADVKKSGVGRVVDRVRVEAVELGLVAEFDEV